MYALLNGEQRLTRAGLATCLVVIVIHIIVSVALTIYLDSYMKADWFKDQETLRIHIRKARMEYEEAHTFCKIIGDHEAVKMHRAAIQRISDAVNAVESEEEPIL